MIHEIKQFCEWFMLAVLYSMSLKLKIIVVSFDKIKAFV